MLLEVDSGDTDRGKRETDPSRGPHQGPVLPSSPWRATVSKEDWQKDREVFRQIQKVQATFVHKTMGFNFFNATSGVLRGDRMGKSSPYTETRSMFHRSLHSVNRAGRDN